MIQIAFTRHWLIWTATTVHDDRTSTTGVGLTERGSWKSLTRNLERKFPQQ